jgi:hypothetical protein
MSKKCQRRWASAIDSAQTLKPSSKTVIPIRYEIPACAGMTESYAGMTESYARMTESCAGMTESCAGMTESCAGMTFNLPA